MSARVFQLPDGRPHVRREKGKQPPRRRPNAAVRSREYLTPDEVDGLIKAAKNIGRHGHRDATVILIAYRHG